MELHHIYQYIKYVILLTTFLRIINTNKVHKCLSLHHRIVDSSKIILRAYVSSFL